MRPAAVPTFQGRARELGRPGSWPWRLRRARSAVPLPGRPGFGGPLTELDREERQEPQAGHPPRARPGEHVLPPGPPGCVSAVGGTGVRAGGQALCRGAPAWHPAAPPGGSTALLHGRSFLLTGMSSRVGAGHTRRPVPGWPGSQSDDPAPHLEGGGPGPERCGGVSGETLGPVSPRCSLWLSLQALACNCPVPVPPSPEPCTD